MFVFVCYKDRLDKEVVFFISLSWYATARRHPLVAHKRDTSICLGILRLNAILRPARDTEHGLTRLQLDSIRCPCTGHQNLPQYALVAVPHPETDLPSVSSSNHPVDLRSLRFQIQQFKTKQAEPPDANGLDVSSRRFATTGRIAGFNPRSLTDYAVSREVLCEFQDGYI